MLQTRLTVQPKPLIDETHSKLYGWISPEGDYYPCGWASHCDLAIQICDSGLVPESSFGAMGSLESAGWIHLSSDAYFNGRNPTQRQLTTLWDVCVNTSRPGVYSHFVKSYVDGEE